MAKSGGGEGGDAGRQDVAILSLLHRGPTELVQNIAYSGSSHRAASHKTDMDWLYRSPFHIAVS
jgi:hypothetical protein